MSRERGRFGFRHRVMAAAAPGMAAAKAFGGQNRARDGAVAVDRLDGVLRAGGRETAALRAAEQKGLRG